MECAGKVLALRRVDPRLAADRAIDQRQQGRRDLHEAHASPHYGGGKPSEIADHPAAQRHDEIAAFEAGLQQPFAQPAELSEALRRLSRLQHDRAAQTALSADRFLQRRQMKGGNVSVRYNRDFTCAEPLNDQVTSVGKQTRGDNHLIGAIAECDFNALRRGHDSIQR